MPTYVYACKSCSHQFEQFQAFTDDSLTDCPECTGLLRKVFNSVGVVFKGSGFYRTDSRGGNSQSSSNSTSKGSDESASGNGETGNSGSSGDSGGSGKSSGSGNSTSGDGASSKSTAPSEGKTPATAAS